jgi:transposase-like protein
VAAGEIQAHLAEVYGAEVSQELISKVGRDDRERRAAKRGVTVSC